MNKGQFLSICFWVVISIVGWWFGYNQHKRILDSSREFIQLSPIIGFLFSLNTSQKKFSLTGIYLQLLIYLLLPNFIFMILEIIPASVGITYVKAIVVGGVVIILIEIVFDLFRR